MTHLSLADEHDVVLVSDLHMGAGAGDPFHADNRFAALLDHLGSRRTTAAGPPRLVLLGDVLDFTLVRIDGRRLDPSQGGALTRLERIAAEHAAVFAALRRLTTAGASLHVVPGNHDLELLSPRVFARFRALVAPSGGTVTLHPWIFHLPGVVYAEHGHQHHDINRVPGLLDDHDGRLTCRAPAGTAFGELVLELADTLGHGDEAAPPPSALLRALRARPGRLLGAAAPGARFARRLVVATARMSRDAGRAARARQETQACAHADLIGLPASALSALARVSAASPSTTTRRLLGRRGHDYMWHAGGEVDAHLRAAGVAVPAYVFGHTHVAQDRALIDGGRIPRYLNPGTWSDLAPQGAERFGFVDITHDTGRPVARLRHWDEAPGTIRTPS